MLEEDFDLALTFSGDACETFDDIVHGFEGYYVRVTPKDDGEPFDAELVGVPRGADWYGTVRVLRWNDEEGAGEGEPFDVRVSALHVY